MNDGSDRLGDFATVLLHASVATVAVTAGAAPPPGAVETLLAGGGLVAKLRGRHRAEAERILADLMRTLEAEWRAWGERSSRADAGARASAAASFEEVIPHAALLPAEVVGQRLDPQEMAQAVLGKAIEARPGLYADADPRNADAHLARTFLLRLTERAYAHLLAQPGYVDQIAPNLWRELFGQLDRIGAGVGEIGADTEVIRERQTSHHEEILRRFEQMEAALAAGVSERELIALVRPIAEDVINVDDAMKELRNVVQATLEERVRTKAGANLGNPLNDVLRQADDFSEEGDFAAEAQALEEARIEIHAAEARLLDRLILNARRRRDPAAAAAHVLARLSNDGPGDFVAVFAVFVQWREEGTRRGLNFDLEVSLHLGHAALKRAVDPRDHANVHDQIGAVCEVLGHRLLRRDLHERADDYFQQAKAGFDRPDTRKEWIRVSHHALQNRATAAAIDGDAAA